jgi:heptosyltransferase II
LTDTPRIVVFGPSWVGDMVMAQSLFMTIKARHPDAFVGVIAPAWTLPVLSHMPEVDLALAADFRHGSLGLSERLTQARVLRSHRFDQAIVLPRSIKSALVPWLARIPRRTGYLGEMRYGLINDVRSLDTTRLPLTVQRFVNLGLSADATSVVDYPQPKLRIDAMSVSAALHGLDLERPSQPLLALCPGAEFGPAKRWPVKHFASLAQRANVAGYAVWMFGSDKDREFTRAITTDSGVPCVDLAGRTGLGEAIDLMSLADVVVSNDSGLMHVAAALERPLVALYGSSSPGFTPPLSNLARVLSLELSCSPCFARVCPLEHFRCLETLEPRTVFDAVESARTMADVQRVGDDADEGLKYKA